MIVVFSSTHHGQTGTTTNALSIALCSALKHHLKVLLASSNFGDVKLTDYLLTKHHRESLSSATTGDLIRLARSGLLKPNAITNYTIPILRNSLLDVLVDYQISEESSEDKQLFMSILKMAERSYDLVILDLSGVLLKMSSDLLIAEADGIVVCSNQNLEVLRTLKSLQKTQPWIADAFICIGNYDKELKFNHRQIKKYLNSDKVFKISYFKQLVDLMNDGNVLEYFGRYFFSEKVKKRNTLLDSVIESTDYLLSGLNMIKE